jgi:HPr kinase/phosphorylase
MGLRASDGPYDSFPLLLYSGTPALRYSVISLPAMQNDAITVERFYTQHASALELNLVAGASGLKRVIREPTVNRPGLVLSGFTRYFANKRVQVVGNAEVFFLKSLPPEQQVKRHEVFFSYKVPCVVFSRNLHPSKLFLKSAEQARVPIFRCPMVTMKFINLATLALEMMFAPRGTEMGSMVDILGVGVIIRGESGIGKSESVLALIERGYSLVADDITKVTLVDGREVVGTSAEVTRDHMEVRGIGIINVAAMFGVKSIRHEKRVDLVITLKSWNEVADVDRLGLEQEYVKILGIDVPHITLPVRPGRDLARLIEVAAFQAKLKSAGYNPAKELNDRLISRMAAAAKL